MKCLFNIRLAKTIALSIFLSAGFGLAMTSFAAVTAPVSLATAPLANSSVTVVKPNLMFILDNSGSMGDNTVPDWAGLFSYTNAWYFKNADFNGLAYNPAVTYEKPVLYDASGALNTTLYPSQDGSAVANGADATTKPNWKAVKDDAYLGGVPTDLTNQAYSYTVIPGEYCKARDLKDCTAATAPTALYIYPAPLRWCSNSAVATGAANPAVNACQSINDITFKYPRFPSPRTTTITVGGTSSTSVTDITVGAQKILSGATTASTSSSTVATQIRDNINKCNTAITGACTVAGYSALVSGSVVTIVAPTNTALAAPIITILGTMTASTAAFTAITGSSAPGINLLTVITPVNSTYLYPGTSVAGPDRTDCPSSCTFAQEMTNYANWWTYYHIRLLNMKTSVSRAFKNIDSRYRVGFTTISDNGVTDGATYQHIDTFEFAQKNAWFTKLLGATLNGSTPLRGALSKVGRLYGNKIAGQTDPMQYSCQQNFAILSTDGYWNTGGETASYTSLNLTGAAVGNKDAGPVSATPRPFYEGPTAVNDSLADIAKYYYDTDLRTPTLSNCTSGSSGNTLCAAFSAPLTDDIYNNVFVSSSDTNNKQHMVTFTMGLGVDGKLNFTTDYETATSGDYYRIKSGTAPTTDWPDPQTGSTSNSVVERIDDLWHAAVNGHGVYFSAKKPNDIVTGFTKALASITSKLGSGAAAATSTLNPVAGNNFAYVASYTTTKWIGNLEARPINLVTGEVSESATWCVENVVADACPAPGTIVVDTSSGSTVYNCVTGTNVVEVSKKCDGRMPLMVSAVTDTRKIWTKGTGAASFNNFTLASGALNASDFNAAKLSGLSQWVLLDSTQQTAATASIVNYLRGQTGFENRTTNLVGVVDNRLFRNRDATLGDAVESQPAFIAKPTFSYLDTGYSAFKSSNSARAGTVYMGANDGMMHAFDGATGDERWAYVPSMVIPNMWAMADENYSSNHAYSANGSPGISDIFDGSTWKTILVAGLNGGGRGYYALDITNPAAPALLWEFTPTDDSDLGYTFGVPEITKKSDGTWVVLVTSGYNNIPDAYPRVKYPRISSGDGKGYLYVLNANTGAKISKIATGVGSPSVPSGLAQITSFVDSAEKNNLATFTYGGDLLGNVWRFDINAGNVTQFAALKDSGGAAQPITTKPELGVVGTSDGNTHHVVFIGTGKYLEIADLTDTQPQTLYAIKDDDIPSSTVTPALINPRGASDMKQQVITTGGANRTVTNNPVDFLTDRGWYVNFPDAGERQNVASQLVLGTLLVPTTVPSNTACSPGGYSWLNYFDYQTGGAVDTASNYVSTKANAPIVGINVIYVPDLTSGKLVPKVSIVTASDPTPQLVPGNIFGSGSKFGFQQRRSIWREILK